MELFLMDISEGEHDKEEYWFNLDSTEAAVVLKLRDIVEEGDFTLRMVLVVHIEILNDLADRGQGREIMPLLALLKATHIYLHGNLSEIDGLLGCPIYLYPRSTLDTFSGGQLADQLNACAAIFLAIDW